jgi:Protein of unknown function with PCYCGC motif
MSTGQSTFCPSNAPDRQRFGATVRVMQRRDFLLSSFALSIGWATTACGGSGSKAITGGGLVARFAKYPVADEPNADLAKVVWPTFVTDAKPEVKTLYEFQLTHGELMRFMPCYCGCGKTAGHKSNRDCYVQKVNADGSAVLDSMAPT